MGGGGTNERHRRAGGGTTTRGSSDTEQRGREQGGAERDVASQAVSDRVARAPIAAHCAERGRRRESAGALPSRNDFKVKVRAGAGA